MNLYEEILKNKEYLSLVNKIENIHFITDGKWDWEHGLGHYKRVAMYAKQILLDLKEQDRTIELTLAASLLHDIGLSKGNKVNHATESARLFSRFLSSQNLSKEELEIIRDAILNHSNGKYINSPVALALFVGDKLDVTYHRTIHSTIQDTINKEFQKIRKVDIKINDKDLKVSYKTEASFDPTILKNWEKAITAPMKAARHLNRKYVFKINEQTVDYQKILS